MKKIYKVFIKMCIFERSILDKYKKDTKNKK